LALLTLILAGCVETAPAIDTDFPAERAGGMFTSGFRHISERYVTPVGLDKVAISGMQRLASLSDDMEVTRVGNEILVTADDTQIGRFAAPNNTDAAGWGRLTVDVVQLGRSAESKLRQALPEEVYRTVFDGLLSPLDGYSRYNGPTKAAHSRANREGFGGIGIRLEVEDDAAHVLTVLPESPAARAGLQTGDSITAIDGEPVAGASRAAIIDQLRGPIDSHVVLSVRRPPQGTELRLSLTRGLILPPTVTFRREGDIGYFRIMAFNRMTAANLARELAHARHDESGALKGIVLDLRGNPGGLLDQAVAVVDMFLDDGVIVATRGRHQASNNRFAATGGDLSGGLPMAILVNGKSASASELVAAALQDHGRAVLIGTTSHGKGSVQNVVRMPNGGELMLTWSYMYAPSGYSLHRLGVLPGICTNPTENIDPLDQRRGGRTDVSDAFAAWHSYGAENAALARTLRQPCPARNTEPETDIETAIRILHDRKIYTQALRPWTSAIAQTPPAEN
jgi:carboxyl-terminal processing protease